ncbi:MAG: signal peptide peptidase SppA, partial [Planctomycetota bacterium]|nr:signal peptide peptidase SppA [Planctomycetota bacterium]
APIVSPAMRRSVRFLLMVFVLSVPVLAQDKLSEATKTVDGKVAKVEKIDTADTPKAKQADKKGAKKPASALKKEAPQPKIGVRQIKISGDYVDLVQPAGLDPLSLLGSGPGAKRSYFKLTSFLDSFSEDDNFDHLVVDLSSGFSMNSAQLDELSRHIKKVTDAGKKTHAWLESASREALEIASMCDTVYMADFGEVDFPSVSMQSIFYRDAMDLVGVKASVVRAGDFKGAVEPYLNARMSDHLRQHYLNMLTSINDAAVDRIAKGRGLETADVREMQSQRIWVAKEALAKGLVDKLAPYGAMQKAIGEDIGENLNWVTPKKAAKKDVSFFQLMGELMAGDNSNGSVQDNTIVVLHLSGAIVDEGGAGSIAAGPTVERIQKLTDEDRVKGVVVRINSPGGSATASEAIRQALKKLAEKKPTVISMGDVAASGGYWISCIGTPIYAERGTITGSIGVFAMKLSGGALMRRIGLHTENIQLDESANLLSLDRGFTEDEMMVMQKSIDSVYGRFLKLVSGARKIPVEKLRTLAGGRVWSGSQAVRKKLVDQIGGVDDCIRHIAKKAELGDEYRVTHRPVTKSGLDLSSLLGSEDEDIISIDRLGGRMIEANSITLRFLRAQGLNTDTLQLLINDSLKARQKPTAWLMGPSSLSIR